MWRCYKKTVSEEHDVHAGVRPEDLGEPIAQLQLQLLVIPQRWHQRYEAFVTARRSEHVRAPTGQRCGAEAFSLHCGGDR